MRCHMGTPCWASAPEHGMPAGCAERQLLELQPDDQAFGNLLSLSMGKPMGAYDFVAASQQQGGQPMNRCTRD